MKIDKFKLIITILLISGLVGLLYCRYGFEISLMSISNSLFIVGIIVFLFGLIIASNAGQIFSSGDYIIRKSFLSNKKSNKFFKTYKDYLLYKSNKRNQNNTASKGLFLLIIGGVFLIISFLLNIYIN